MTVKECYKKMDGDYEKAVRLMGNDERIIKYLKIFQRDPNFDSLCNAIEQSDFKTAFNAAHTLKGVALNLSLTSLAEKTINLTEMLRSCDPSENMALLLQNTKTAYKLVIESIDALLDI